ncbi:hypothetical protein G6L90_20890 [Agrobacterium tumefaciens]|uniref:hypothetical protein n=1 Tax=Agrobacterium tumefaciens TaxID=358 RepID=UPI001574B3A5|nr:hypothetical protein [Agrobacterium tumefaciens]WHO24091.1 hypothetical protein G6L90_20890 [Agrobacterium tumefaciens]
MRNRRILYSSLFVLSVACWGLVTAQPTSGAEINKSTKDVCVLKLEGEIIRGDFSRLVDIAAKEFSGFDGESSAHDTICLDSPGGDVTEGVKLAEFFYTNGVGTVIEDGAECYSMCAIMFMMGIAQGPEVTFVNRKLHINGKLGFHRPYLSLTTESLVSTKVLAVAHDVALENMSKIMVLANNLVPWSNSTMMRPDLIQEMLKHIGNDFFYIDTVEKAGRFEIELVGLPKHYTPVEERAYYACENSFHWQVGLMKEPADARKFRKPVTEDEAVVKLLQEEGDTKYFSVVSMDAGYSEAGCVIAVNSDTLRGCGYNGVYNVLLGQGACTMENFADRSGHVGQLASYRPGLKLQELGGTAIQPKNSSPKPIIGAKVPATCTVLSRDGLKEVEPCAATLTMNVLVDNRRTDRYEFVWPTGNRTILARDGDLFSINGKPSIPYSEDGYTLCALNSETKNRFCFKL